MADIANDLDHSVAPTLILPSTPSVASTISCTSTPEPVSSGAGDSTCKRQKVHSIDYDPTIIKRLCIDNDVIPTTDITDDDGAIILTCFVVMKTPRRWPPWLSSRLGVKLRTLQSPNLLDDVHEALSNS